MGFMQDAISLNKLFTYNLKQSNGEIMKFTRALVFLLTLCAGPFLGICFAQASATINQIYPNKPIKIIVGFAPGGLPDLTARAIAEPLSAALKQPVIIENRPGAGGTIAANVVANAEPDGHTLLAVTSAHAAAPALYSKLQFDPSRDFSAVSVLATTAMVLIAPPSLGTKNVNDLIALAKSKPGQLNFSSAGIGSNTHLSMEVFKSKAGIDIAHIPLKGIPEAITETMTGRVQLFMTPIGPTLPTIKSGKVIALASSGPRRSALLPDVPTVSESGLPSYRWEAWIGLLAPAKTPRSIVARLDKEIAQILTRQDIKEQWTRIGAEMSPSTPEQFDQIIKDEIEIINQAAKVANIRPE